MHENPRAVLGDFRGGPESGILGVQNGGFPGSRSGVRDLPRISGIPPRISDFGGKSRDFGGFPGNLGGARSGDFGDFGPGRDPGNPGFLGVI